MIAIIDYGLGNVQSVAGAVEKLGFKAVITSSPEELQKADKLILPGVGAFADGMKNLHNLGLIKVLNTLVLEQKKPILGICLGFQLMARESYEFGHHTGLGWLDASVIRLEPGNNLRVPHVGWNGLQQRQQNVLFENIPAEALFYYTHSFHVKMHQEQEALGKCSYGISFTSAAKKENIYGTQFHPEKSQQFGLKLLENFLKKG